MRISQSATNCPSAKAETVRVPDFEPGGQGFYLSGNENDGPSLLKPEGVFNGHGRAAGCRPGRSQPEARPPSNRAYGANLRAFPVLSPDLG